MLLKIEYIFGEFAHCYHSFEVDLLRSSTPHHILLVVCMNIKQQIDLSENRFAISHTHTHTSTSTQGHTPFPSPNDNNIKPKQMAWITTQKLMRKILARSNCFVCCIPTGGICVGKPFSEIYLCFKLKLN